MNNLVVICRYFVLSLLITSFFYVFTYWHGLVLGLGLDAYLGAFLAHESFGVNVYMYCVAAVLVSIPVCFFYVALGMFVLGVDPKARSAVKPIMGDQS